ncbi:MAG: preprotein translocase subunit SecY, partial [Christensenella sp.]
MFKTLANAWKMPDIRKKILFTLLMLLIYRIGAYIPVPGVNVEFIASAVKDYDILGFLNLFSGGSLANMTIFALGIIPYINASIIMNLLTVAIPKLERLAKEGDDGRKKIASITRILGVLLGLVQAIGILISLTALAAQKGAAVVEPNATWFTYVTIVVCLTAGTALIMWIGERITERGIGNGISLLIFISIIARVPSMILGMFDAVKAGQSSFWSLVLVV